MTPNEKTLIEDLFNRLRTAAPSGRDAEAESAIAAEMARSPGAAYALVQTVLVQDQALHEAHDRVQAAETAAREAAQQAPQQPEQPQRPQSFLERAGSALGGFGGQRDRPTFQQAQAPEQPQARQGGGFLSGALQTAAGVAGGALLFEGVRSMFGGGGGGLLGGGSSPWGGGGTTVNETIINEGSDKDRDDNTRDASDNRDNNDRDDDNVQDASYDADDDSFDDGPDGSDDDSWV
ncbi:DUF2076 domain-containing protein [Labrys okinawensis]|uniref:DUF2076 domain-containing protein n=1 Tax=Labrys okinawensis TaxID=346911 RepID=UPI0039BC50B4